MFAPVFFRSEEFVAGIPAWPHRPIPSNYAGKLRVTSAIPLLDLVCRSHLNRMARVCFVRSSASDKKRQIGRAALDFALPAGLVAYLAELDQFIAREIRPIEAADDNIRFFDHRREWARTDFENGGLPRHEWEALLRRGWLQPLDGRDPRAFCLQGTWPA